MKLLVFGGMAWVGQNDDALGVDALNAGAVASMENFSVAKTTCENATLAGLGGSRTVIGRPGLIGGPGDLDARSNERALVAGLAPRPLSDALAALLHWEITRGNAGPRGSPGCADLSQSQH